MEMGITPADRLYGKIEVPGDKSISHRALILASMAEGPSVLEGLLHAGDILSTYACLRHLGINFMGRWDKLTVEGKGLNGFKEPAEILDAGNSGTTARLLMGLLAAQPFFSVLTGDHSLKKRPMGRISSPLQQMGACIDGRSGGTFLPLSMRGGPLEPLNYALPVASAQLKSALLIASLYCQGVSQLAGAINSRDHTERMLRTFGCKLTLEGGKITLAGDQHLQGRPIKVPGDLSAASFFLVAGVLAGEGEITIKGVGVNPGRTGILEILSRMGAEINLSNHRLYGEEPVADLLVEGGKPLTGVEVEAAMIPRLVDEIPVLVVAAAYARGKTVIRGAAELRLKESDRLHTLTLELGKMGAAIEEQADGLMIEGKGKLKGARCHSHGDHRIAMALAIAALFACGETVIEDTECTDISYPLFFKTLQDLCK